jgi:WD40 repeat protein
MALHCRIANCEDRVLVAAVDERSGVVIVVDAFTSEVIYKFFIEEEGYYDYVRSVAASQTPDGRILVVTGDFYSGLIRMRVADSGDLIGQWQGLRNNVYDVAIAVKAGMAMGAYGSAGLWIWSFGEENYPAITEDAPLPRATDAWNNQSNHSGSVSSIAFSVDGKVAASRSYFDKFVLVWDTATGTVTRRLDIDEAGLIRPLRVAVSSSGDWILCASIMEGDHKTFYLNLWGPSNQEFSASFRDDKNMRLCRVTINPFQDRLHGAHLRLHCRQLVFH